MMWNIILLVICCGYLVEIQAQSNVCQNGPPKGTNPSACCSKTKSFDETIMKTCFDQFKSSQPRVGKGLQGPLNGFECIFECVLNATNAISNDRPNPQALIQKITAVLSSQPEWIPVVTAGVNYCAAQVTSNATKLRSSLKGDQVNGRTICSPTAAFLVGCMFTYEFRNCPLKMWNSSDTKCTELRNYFNNCPTPLIN